MEYLLDLTNVKTDAAILVGDDISAISLFIDSFRNAKSVNSANAEHLTDDIARNILDTIDNILTKMTYLFSMIKQVYLLISLLIGMSINPWFLESMIGIVSTISIIAVLVIECKDMQ